MPKIYQRAAARRDLVEHFVYLAENANLETAERFLAQTEASFNVLAEQPLIGAPLTLRDPTLAGIVRVLHAARNWWSLLGIEA